MNLDKTTAQRVGVGAKRRWKRHCPDWAILPTFSPLKKERVLAGFVPGLAVLSWSLVLLFASAIAQLAGAHAFASGLFWFCGATFVLALVLIATTFLVAVLRSGKHC